MLQSLLSRASQRTYVIVVVLLSLAGAIGCGAPTESKPAMTDAQSVHRQPDMPISASIDSVKNQDFTSGQRPATDAYDRDAEIRRLRSLLVQQPDDYERLFELAALNAEEGNLAEAISLLQSVPENHPSAGLPALGQIADWQLQREQFDAAERGFRRLTQLAPDATIAQRKLAYLLNRQGRRLEASVNIRNLCRLGDVRQDELQSLIIVGDAIKDSTSISINGRQMSYKPISNLGLARIQFNNQLYDEVLITLQPLIESDHPIPAAVALYGRAAVEHQNLEAMQRWIAIDAPGVDKHSDQWAARGTRLLAIGNFQQSIRALGEAVKRDPTDLVSLGRLRQALLAIDEIAIAGKLESRWRGIRESLRLSNQIEAKPDPEVLNHLANQLESLGNRLPAILWRMIEATARQRRDLQPRLQEEYQKLLSNGNGFPSTQERLCGLQLNNYPKPNKKDLELPLRDRPAILETEPTSFAKSNAKISLFDTSDEVGLQHSFRTATSPKDSGYTIYQILGGAIAILDYDLSGSPDIYLGQGAAEPPGWTGNQSNQLLRNLGERLENVTANSNTSDFEYSTGITTGDWNQDGFPDLFVSNLTSDRMLLNNGDGTFTCMIFTPFRSSPTRVPTSNAMADLTGDGLPDLLQLSYINDANLTVGPPRDPDGQVIAPVLPTQFLPGNDRLFTNDGKGGFSVRDWEVKQEQRSTGLGMILANFDGLPGLEVFIGNDLRPNQLWVKGEQPEEWREEAIVRGCAFGFTGNATASMGIACDDFDANGELDLHITNYQDDSASLFMSKSGFFQDQASRQGLNQPSRAVLGFGTQPIDCDNDRDIDIIVTNGHLEAAASTGTPQKQPPQLFLNSSGAFELAAVDDPSGYWSDQHIGRSLARLDFNQDGLDDIIVSHIEAPTALLLNQTVQSNHFVQLQCVGTYSERDAVGTRVELRANGESTFHWVRSGDGYLCRNEQLLTIGLGQCEKIDGITVTWPNGMNQTFEAIEVDRKQLLVQGETFPFCYDRLDP